jgi:hypothetical protein
MTQPTIRIGDDDAAVSLRADDVFSPPTPGEVAGPSPLEQLRKALAAPVAAKPLTLRVPERPGVTLRFSTGITQEQRTAWQKRSTKKSRRQNREDEVDEMNFACLVLANTNEAIAFGGVDAHDRDDTPLTFAMPALWEMVSAADPVSAIRNLFGNDAHVLLASGEVLLASGFDDDLEETDPTTAS